MERELLQLLTLFAALLVLLVPAVFFEDVYNVITGEAFHGARGGTINYVEFVYAVETTPNWHGVYGLILSFWGGETPMEFNGSAGNITRHDIKSNITSGYVMITNSSSPPVVSRLAPGNVSMLDSITGDGADSASNTFTTLRSFRFNGTVISNVPSTNMTTVAPQEWVYELYFLQDNESLIIAAPMELHMIGFNGEIADYQAMVPQGNQSPNLTYYIHLIMNYTAPPVTPTPSQPGVGGGGGGAAVSAGARAVSGNKSIEFEGPFQLRNNTAFRNAVYDVFAEPPVNETLDDIMNYSLSVKSNFSGTVFVHSGGSVSVLVATIRYSGEELSNVVLWNRLPDYFVDGSLAVDAPEARTVRVASNEMAFVYPALTRGDEILLVYRVEKEVNASVLDDISFEVYAEPQWEGIPPAICEDGEVTCEDNAVAECADGAWVLRRLCLYGCEAGECVERAETPDVVSLMLLFISWVIIMLIIAVVFLICYHVTERRRKRPAKGGGEEAAWKETPEAEMGPALRESMRLALEELKDYKETIRRLEEEVKVLREVLESFKKEQGKREEAGAAKPGSREDAGHVRQSLSRAISEGEERIAENRRAIMDLEVRLKSKASDGGRIGASEVAGIRSDLKSLERRVFEQFDHINKTVSEISSALASGRGKEASLGGVGKAGAEGPSREESELAKDLTAIKKRLERLEAEAKKLESRMPIVLE